MAWARAMGRERSRSRGKSPSHGKRGRSRDRANEEQSKMMAAVMQRAAAIDRHLDLIPVRFYLGSENVQVTKERKKHNLDPAKAKSTSQLVVAAAAQDEEGQHEMQNGGASSSSGRPKTKSAKRREQRRGNRRSRSQDNDSDAPRLAADRPELHARLERRIEELKEERRRKQSQADKEKNAAAQAAQARPNGQVPHGSPQRRPAANGAASSGQAPPQRGSAAPGAPRSAGNGAASSKDPAASSAGSMRPPLVPAASSAGSMRPPLVPNGTKHAGGPEIGRIRTEPSTARLPFQADVGRKGAKAQRICSEVRKAEADQERIQRAVAQGRGEEVRRDLGMQKALKRAQGEKVHDNIQKLRKAQKSMEVKHLKGKEKWQAMKDLQKQMADDRQAKRKENLAKPRSKKAKLRNGFEGNRGAVFLNSDR